MKWMKLLLAVTVTLALGVSSRQATAAPQPQREVGYSVVYDVQGDAIAAVATDLTTGLSIHLDPLLVPADVLIAHADELFDVPGIFEAVTAGGGSSTVMQTPIFDAVTDSWTIVVTSRTSSTETDKALSKRHFETVDATLAECKARADKAKVDYDALKKAHPYGT